MQGREGGEVGCVGGVLGEEGTLGGGEVGGVEGWEIMCGCRGRVIFGRSREKLHRRELTLDLVELVMRREL